MNEQEGYTYPGTHVLKNKGDIRDLAALQRFERGATAIRIQELHENPVRGEYGLAHLQTIHTQVFKDVYQWAGEVRKVDIAKGGLPATCGGQVFSDTSIGCLIAD